MEKNVSNEKQHEGSFDSNDKEPFANKLKMLMRGRTVRRCSEDWGINLSTLKNYFSRPDAKPRYEVLSKISNVEGVSVEWLLGEKDSFESKNKRCGITVEERQWHKRLSEMLFLLGENELEALTKQLTMKGLVTILYLLNDDNIRLLQLPSVLKEQILTAHQANSAEALNNKVCASPEAEKSTQLGLTSKHKKAV